MEIRNLVTFLKVTELQSFSKAAEALDYSQSAVTVQVQRLEEELGVRLFDRIGKKVTITQYGLEFIPYARDTISAASRAASFAARDCEITGTVTIGIVETLLRATLSDIITAYHKRFPKVLVKTKLGTNQQLKTELAKNNVDLIYTLDSHISDPQFSTVFEMPEELVIIANSQNPLSRQETVRLADLVSHPFILMNRENPYRDLFDSALAQQGLSVQPFLELESDVISLRLVNQNPDFLSILPYFTFKRSILRDTLATLPVVDCKMQQWRQLLYHSNKVITPQIQGMLDIITEISEHG